MEVETQVIRQKTPLDPQSLQLVHEILASLLSKKESMIFKVPVDYIALNLLDYPKVIKKMMDLGTVEKNLNSSIYDNVETCLDDIQLIWDNCKLYNVEDSIVYKLARKLEVYTQKLVVEKFGDQIKYGENNESYKVIKEDIADVEAMDEFVY